MLHYLPRRHPYSIVFYPNVVQSLNTVNPRTEVGPKVETGPRIGLIHAGLQFACIVYDRIKYRVITNRIQSINS